MIPLPHRFSRPFCYAARLATKSVQTSEYKVVVERPRPYPHPCKVPKLTHIASEPSRGRTMRGLDDPRSRGCSQWTQKRPRGVHPASIPSRWRRLSASSMMGPRLNALREQIRSQVWPNANGIIRSPSRTSAESDEDHCDVDLNGRQERAGRA